MGEKGGYSSSVHEETTRIIKDRKESVTAHGEQRHREGKGLDKSVDPKNHRCYRESVNYMIPQGDLWLLPRGIAIPFKNDFDTTGSMSNNVDLAFAALPKIQKLLIELGLLGRYHGQFASGVIQDAGDNYPYQSTEFETDNRMADQMRYLVPEGQGGDSPEEYQFSLWYQAERVKSTIWNYGLKGYYFIIGDERGRNKLETSSSGFEKTFGSIESLQSIDVESLGKEVLEKWHTFFLQVGSDSYTTDYWRKVLGDDRVIILPKTELIPEVEAAIVGLTEGMLDLQTLKQYLVETAKVSPDYAERIRKCVSQVPVRAQANLPNFNNIPLAGAVFANRQDLYPINWNTKEKNNSSELKIKL